MLKIRQAAGSVADRHTGTSISPFCSIDIKVVRSAGNKALPPTIAMLSKSALTVNIIICSLEMKRLD